MKALLSCHMTYGKKNSFFSMNKVL